MSGLRIGELFAGYGGLGLAVQAAIGGDIAWVSEVDKGANKILAHRFPGVPNIGDITKVDWSTVEPVDVITGGSPCQDLSTAGRRAGMTEGTRSNLWVAMREAIATLRPRLVVWENVAGAYSAEADSDLGSDPRLLDGTRRRTGEPVLRALGRVLGDLASLGYVGGWHGLRAADVGACHGRLRVFVVAYPAGYADLPRLEGRPTAGERASERAAGPDGVGALLPSPRTSDTNGAGQHGDGGLDLRTAVTMLPTPSAADGNGGGRYSSEGHQRTLPGEVRLLPTPACNDMGASYTPDEWDAWTERMKAAHGNGNGHGASLSIEAQRLLPTPVAMDGTGSRTNPGGNLTLRGALEGTLDSDEGRLAGARQWEGPTRPIAQDWGQYAAAIHRWEQVTRPAPPPTETGPKGNPRLSAAFSEWMMGLPAGWVTDVPGITRNEALRALGNGVVPQQAEAAVRFLLATAASVGAA